MKIITSIPARNLYFRETQKEAGDVRSSIERSVVNVFDKIKYQQILDFGGAFTESAAYNYSLLAPEQKQETR